VSRCLQVLYGVAVVGVTHYVVFSLSSLRYECRKW
jgi:hypothetical protein